MFHAQDGWFFERLEDGSVAIHHNPDNVPNQSKSPVVTVSPNVWASIVASVSARGEEGGRYYDALKFHSDTE